MIRAINYEFQRLFHNERIRVILFFVLAFSIYFIFTGVSRFKAQEVDNKSFLEYEKLKFTQYVTPEQYGGYGFRIIYNPPALSIFAHCNSMPTTESNVDNKETVKFSQSIHGGKFFSNNGYFNGFFDFFVWFGTLLALYLGISRFRNLAQLKFWSSKKTFLKILSSNLLILSILVLLFYSCIFLIPLCFGVEYANTNANNFFSFGLFSTVLFIFFYLLGCSISLLKNKSRSRNLFIYGLVFWILFLLIIPEVFGQFISNLSLNIESVERINIEKLRNTKQFELESKRFYLDSVKKGKDKQLVAQEIMKKYLREVHTKNDASEKRIHSGIKAMLEKNEKISIFSPISFYKLSSNEIAGIGYRDYFGFLRHVMQVRNDFLKFYIQQRYYSKGNNVESFVKGDENIYRAKSQLPSNFWAGLGITGLYSLLLFGLCLWMFQKRKKVDFHLIKQFPVVAATPGTAFHVQCRDTETRNRAYNHLVRQEDVIGLDNFKAVDLDVGLPPSAIVPYFCHIFEVKDLQKVEENIKKIGVKDFRLFKRMKRADLEEEDLLKLYCAVILAKAEKYENIVLNETLDKVSEEFERRVLDLLDELLKKPRRIIYFSNRCFGNKMLLELDEMVSDDELELSPLKLNRVSFR